MFAGIVEEVGRVKGLRRTGTGAKLTVETGLGDIGEGDSVAVNGVCLTVVKVSGGFWSSTSPPRH
ncbi:MAG: hypothetical protein Q9N34_03240 [Aquificota bacterium]|nr:hypothetical protein [Aquificota bacterium]